MCNGSKIILTVGLIISLIFCSFIFILEPGRSQSLPDQPGVPMVTIDLIQDSQTAEVGPGEDGIVHFDGVVNVTKPPGTRVVVSLTAQDTWGTAVASPSSILFESNGQKSFGVDVRAPDRESSDSSGVVTVTGRWSLYPGGLSGHAEPREGTQGIIYIAQFYKFSLSTSKIQQRTEPGSEVELDLKIKNLGNGQDSFTIRVRNADELSDKGINTKLDVSNVVTREDENSTVKINVDVPSSANIIGIHSIIVEVASDNGVQEGLPPETITYAIRVPDEDLFATTEFSMLLNIFIIIIIVVFIVLIWHWRKKRGLKDQKEI